jgi:hypothetical protein
LPRPPIARARRPAQAIGAGAPCIACAIEALKSLDDLQGVSVLAHAHHGQQHTAHTYARKHQFLVHTRKSRLVAWPFHQGNATRSTLLPYKPLNWG